MKLNIINLNERFMITLHFFLNFIYRFSRLVIVLALTTCGPEFGSGNCKNVFFQFYHKNVA